MRIRIRAEPTVLSRTARAAIDSHVRIMLGTRAGQIETLDVVLGPTHLGTEHFCRLSLHTSSGLESVEEVASDQFSAIKWAIWRCQHLIDRRALRDEAAGHRKPGQDRSPGSQDT